MKLTNDALGQTGPRAKGWRSTVRLDFREGCQWKIVTVRGGANNAPEI